MKTKYKKGDYMLTLFNEVGKRKKVKKFKNYLTAKQKLDEFEKKHPGRSGVITRVLYNSADKVDKWSYSYVK